jgi:outer membrane protein TolC
VFKLFCLTIFTISFLCLSTIIRAESSAEPTKLSLEAAVRIATESNPMLGAARNDSAAAEARGAMAGAARRPSISATAFLTNGDMPGVLSGPASVMPAAISSYLSNRFQDRNVMLMAPLDVSRRLSRESRAARRRAAAAGTDAERTRQDTVLEVRMAYYDALFKDQRVAAYQKAVDVAEEQLKNDEAALAAGKVPSYYVDRDRAEAAMNRQLLAEAQLESQTSLFKLAALLGLDPATPIELTDSLEPPAASAPEELPSATPDITAARSRVSAADASVDAARRAFIPDVNLTLMYDSVSARDSETMDGTTAAIVAAWPIWDGGMRRAAVRESAAMRDAAANELRGTELRVRSDFLSTRLEFDTAMKNIDTAGVALKSAEENYRVAKIRYDAGKGILVEMLDALTALTRARVNRIEAVRNALVARDMLLRLTGQL